MADLPETQYAVQLVGEDKLILNKSKQIFRPNRHQILCKVEAVGLCFSDLKLLKQFRGHVRKSEIISGIDTNILKDIPSYVPGEQPTVPGHEAVVRIVQVGPNVKNFAPGGRYLVQADYRWLKTTSSNAAFGYNFEGALQEYVLMDERVIFSPQGQCMLIPVSERLSASAIALVEPWACVEQAYACKERSTLKAGGQMLAVADVKIRDELFRNLLNQPAKPAQITWLSKFAAPRLNIPIKKANNLSQLEDGSFDDVIYFGWQIKTAQALFEKTANGGLFNIVLCGGKFGENVALKIGRVHYGGIRIVGTTGWDPSQSMKYIPNSGEIRPSDKINIIGAGGPMGMMHVIRNICQKIAERPHPPSEAEPLRGMNKTETHISIFAGDVDENRLRRLSKIAAPLAQKNRVEFIPYNPTKDKIEQSFNYTVILAPIPDLVGPQIGLSAKRGIINIFAGISTEASCQINLDEYIEKQLYFIGTSGSDINDMKQVLAKVEAGTLDTNASVAAICGLENAIEGIRAVENRLFTGKIIVYPSCTSLELLALEQLDEKLPKVAKHLNNGLWSKKAEKTLLTLWKN